MLSVCLLVAAGCAPTEDAPEPASPQVVGKVTDHHLHIRGPEGARILDQLAQLEVTPPPGEEPHEPVGSDAAIEAMDRADVGRALVLSNAYMFGMPDVEVEDEAAKVRTENDYVAAQVARFPERLLALCSVNPLRDYALSEVERCGRDPRFSGLKLHLANSDLDFFDDSHVAALGAVFELAEELSLPILVHLRTRNEAYGAEDVKIFVRDVLAGVTVPVQIAHMAGWGGYDGATDSALGEFVAALADGRLTSSPITFGLGAVVFDADVAQEEALAQRVRDFNQKLAERIRELGTQRIVYATDWPSWPPVPDPAEGIAANVGLIRKALPLTEAELEEILGNVGPIFSVAR